MISRKFEPITCPTTMAEKPRAPRKKAEPKAPGGGAKGGKVSCANSAATARASNDEEDFKGDNESNVKEDDERNGLSGDNVAAREQSAAKPA